MGWAVCLTRLDIVVESTAASIMYSKLHAATSMLNEMMAHGCELAWRVDAAMFSIIHRNQARV